MVRLVPALALLLFGSSAWAAQSPEQRACIDAVSRAAVRLTSLQTSAHLYCLWAGGTVCSGVDHHGHVASAASALLAADAEHCQAAAELPDFAYLDATRLRSAALSMSAGIWADLMGAGAGGGVLPLDPRSPDGRCRIEGVFRTAQLFEQLWREGREALDGALSGEGRTTGHGPVDSADELQSEVVSQLLERSPLMRREAGRVRSLLIRRCGAASHSVAELFPGLSQVPYCQEPSGSVELAYCVETVARRRFFQSIGALHALPVSCDLIDNGSFDLSCSDAEQEQHVLDRAGYGPDAWSRERIRRLGVRGYLLEQLHPESIPDDQTDALLQRFGSLSLTIPELRDRYPPVPDDVGDPEANDLPPELRRAKLMRAIASRRQLSEVLADVLYNHFNVDGGVGELRWYTTFYDREAIRGQLWGRFADAVLAVARSPAMLDYLDNRLNRAYRLNENFARELLELHTLGTDGFAESEVVGAARVFTGWRIAEASPDGFEFHEPWHDADPKQVLGLSFPAGGGEEEGVALIEHLVAQRATAERIAEKLVQRFVGEPAPERLVQRAADLFQLEDGDLRAVVKLILFSPEFLLYRHHRGTKVKRPHLLLASAARSLGVDPARIDLDRMARHSRDMGEQLHGAPSPKGHPDTSSAWTSPGALVQRFNELERMARGLNGAHFDLGIEEQVPVRVLEELVGRLRVARLSVKTWDEGLDLLGDLQFAPFEDRVEQATAYLLSSPEFVQH